MLSDPDRYGAHLPYRFFVKTDGKHRRPCRPLWIHDV